MKTSDPQQEITAASLTMAALLRWGIVLRTNGQRRSNSHPPLTFPHFPTISLPTKVPNTASSTVLSFPYVLYDQGGFGFINENWQGDLERK